MPKPELVYWITAVISLSVSFFFEGTVDITTHDTYFVVANWHIAVMLATLFALFGLVHFALRRVNRRTSKPLFMIHFLATTGGLTVLFFMLSMEKPRQFMDYSVLDELESIDQAERMNQWVSIIILILLIAQICFLINVIRSFIAKQVSN